MTFDPMTGEPIEDDNNLKFDPMTGEPIGQQPKQDSEEPVAAGGFDPMTGEPIGQQPRQDSEEPVAAGGFDPMTGQPIGQQSEPAPAQQTGGFDPMTGAPIGQQPGSAPAQKTVEFDPMTGQPVQGKSKKKSKLPVILGGIAACVVVVVLAVIIVASVVMGKSGKVMLATANTFKDGPHFVEALKPLSVLQGDKYTVEYSCNVSNVKLSGEVRNSGSEKQVSMDLSSNGDKLGLLAGIDSKAVKVEIPALSKYVFVYNYTGKNTGYLMDEADEEDIEAINAMLSIMSKKTNNLYAEAFSIFKDELKTVKFVDAEKEEYEIDGKDVNCKGYTAILTGSNMAHIIEKLEKYINDEYAPLFEIADVDMADFEKEFDKMKDEALDMDNIELTFYIYKNQLAAIIYDNQETDEKVELRFQGGDYRMQNMVLRTDDYRLKIAGSDKGSKERFDFSTNGNSIGSLEYNYDSGRFSANVSGMSVEGKLLSSKSEVNLKISDIKASYYYSISPDLDITVKKGSKMDKYDGKEFDLGNADKDDYMDLLDDIQDKVYDGDYKNLMRSLGLYSYLY